MNLEFDEDCGFLEIDGELPELILARDIVYCVKERDHRGVHWDGTTHWNTTDTWPEKGKRR